MVVAKTTGAQKPLRPVQKQGDEKGVRGGGFGGDEKEFGSVQVSDRKKPSNRVKMTALSGTGRDAETGWEVVERLRGATLVKIEPEPEELTR